MPVCKAGFRYVPSGPPPAGISFFTFQLVAFAIDRFRGTIPAMPNPLEFSLFISFFPHILSGPLSRFAAVQAQLKKIMQALPWNNIKAAVPFIVIGLTYKVLVADTLALILEPMTSRPEKLGILSCSYVFFANSYKLYFDFLGYSLTAIGLGKIFGIRLPANFDLPYLAKNPRDFWRRWHISLSLWIRDYIYLPLGGKQQYARNILITFFFVDCGMGQAGIILSGVFFMPA